MKTNMTYGTYSRLHYSRDRSIKMKIHVGGACVQCGYSSNYAALDFHHINPDEKSFLVNGKAKGTWERRLEEANKCLLLCKNCHASLHFPEMSKDAWLERVELRAAITATNPPYTRGADKKKRKNAKTVLQKSPKVKVEYKPIIDDRDPFVRMAEVIRSSAIAVADEMMQPGWVQPSWVTDEIKNGMIAMGYRERMLLEGATP
jgi:hypothetical protein